MWTLAHSDTQSDTCSRQDHQNRRHIRYHTACPCTMYHLPDTILPTPDRYQLGLDRYSNIHHMLKADHTQYTILLKMDFVQLDTPYTGTFENNLDLALCPDTIVSLVLMLVHIVHLQDY